MNLLENKYLNNSLWLLLEKFLLMGISLFVGVLVVRYLGKEQYGFYSYVLSILMILEVFSTFGLGNIIVNEIVKKNIPKESVLGTAFFFQTIGGSLAFIATLTILGFIDYEEKKLLYFTLAILTLPLKSFRIISFYFDAKVLGKFNALIRTSILIVVNLLKVLIILLKAPVLYFYIILIIDAVLYSTLYIIYYRKNQGSPLKWKIDSKLFRVFFKSGISLVLSSFLINIYLRADQIMIKNFLGNEENGLYAAAVKISSSWYGVGWVIILALFPALINSYTDSEVKFNKRFISLVQLMIILGFAVALPFNFFADDIVKLLFGKSFEKSGTPLKIHIWSAILIFIYFIQEKWYVIKKLEKYFFLNSSIGVFINITLNYFLIEKLGIDVAAYNTLIGISFSLIIMPLLFNETRDLFKIQIKAVVTIFKLNLIEFISNAKKN